MKKIMLLLVLIFCLHVTSAQAITIIQTGTKLKIDDTTIDIANASQINYSNKDQTTLIYMSTPKGEIFYIPSNSNEYSQILKAVRKIKNIPIYSDTDYYYRFIYQPVGIVNPYYDYSYHPENQFNNNSNNSNNNNNPATSTNSNISIPKEDNIPKFGNYPAISN